MNVVGRVLLVAALALLAPAAAWAQSDSWGLPGYENAPLTLNILANKTLNRSINLGNGSLTVNGAPLRALPSFTQTYGNEPMQSQFWGLNAGASYLTSGDSGFGIIGIGVGALQSVTSPGPEDVAIGPLSSQFLTGGLTTSVGMHSVGSEVSAPGDTALGADAIRDAISFSNAGYLTALGESALAHGAPYNGVVGVGSQAGRGNSSAVGIGGTVTTGDVESLVLSSSVSGLSGVPLTASHTNAGGDTLSSICNALQSQINQKINGPSYEIGAFCQGLPDGTYSLWLAFPGNSTTGWAISIAPTVTGSATETLTVSGGSSPANSVFIGKSAGIGYAMQSPIGLVAIGDSTLQNCEGVTGCNYSIAIGYNAGSNLTTGYNDILVGYAVGMNMLGAHNNTGVGFSALSAVTTGNQVAGFGTNACGADTTGSNNLCVGYHAGSATLATGNGNILIASGAQAVDTPLSTTSSYINIENILTVTGTSTPSSSVAQFAGLLNVVGAYQANGTSGVSCTGTPTSGFASVNGIVTHC